MKSRLLLLCAFILSHAFCAFAQTDEDNISYLRVQKQMEAGNYQRAVEILEGLSPEAKESPFFPSYSAECYENLGDYEKAVFYYKKIYKNTRDFKAMQKAADMEEKLAIQQTQQREAQQKAEEAQAEAKRRQENRLEKERKEKAVVTERRRVNMDKNTLILQFFRKYMIGERVDTLEGYIFVYQSIYENPKIDMSTVKEIYIRRESRAGYKCGSCFFVGFNPKQSQYDIMDPLFIWKNKNEGLNDFQKYVASFSKSMNEMGISVSVNEKFQNK